MTLARFDMDAAFSKRIPKPDPVKFTRKVNYFKAVITLTGSVLVSQALVAQDESTNGDATERETLDEIRVVAEKVEQNIEDVPLSLSALEGVQIEALGAVDLTDLNGLVPNTITQRVMVGNGGSFSIRGIGFYETDPLADSKTQVLLDGAPHARNTGVMHDQLDIERVEILRGPQGPLFGRTSLAGTINVITKDASDEPGFVSRLSLAQYGSQHLRLSAESGNILDGSVRSRLSAGIRNYDGHVKNDFDGEYLGGTDATNLRLKVDHDVENVHSTLTAYWLDEEIDGLPVTSFQQDPFGNSDGDVHLVRQDEPGFATSEEGGLTLRSDVGVDAGTVTFLANTQKADFLSWFDLDGRAGTMPPVRGGGLIINLGFGIEHEENSLEIRFRDSHSERWDYTAGMFFFGEDSTRTSYQNNGAPYADTYGFDEAFITVVADQQTKTTAAFGQADYHLTDAFSLVLGGRLTQIEKTVNIRHDPRPPPAEQTPPRRLELTSTWDEPTWRFGGTYDVSDETMVYLTSSTGFKPGGFNGRATRVENIGPYEAEYATNHELGLKTELMDRRARLSAAAFVTDYEKLVGLVRRPNFTGRGTEAIAINLGDVDIRGVELESEWLLSNNLSMNLSLGHLDASWAEFMVDLNNDGIETDNSHLDVMMAPRWSAFGRILYSREVDRIPDARLELSLDARYQSRYNSYGQSNEDTYYRLGTTKWNGSISLLWGEGNSVALFGRNLTNEDAIAFAYNALVPWGTFDPPRVIGIEIQLTR